MTCTDTIERPPYYTLIFSGAAVGDKLVQGYKTVPKRATEINIRQNFWANYVLMDGRYPALWYEHSFMIYEEKAGPHQYAKSFYDKHLTVINTIPLPLVVRNGVNSQDIVAFGSCYGQPLEQQQPDELLLYEAGIFRAVFWGTCLPSVITSIA